MLRLLSTARKANGAVIQGRSFATKTRKGKQKGIKRPLGTGSKLLPPEQYLPWRKVPSAYGHQCMEDKKMKLKRERLTQKDRPAIVNPNYRTHVSISVEANKRDIWDLVSQWDQKQVWYPSHTVTHTEDVPETNWLYDKIRVLKVGDTEVTEGLCEVMDISRHVTIDFGPGHSFPFENYVYTLKVTPWGDSKTVVDWVSNYTVPITHSATQAECNEKVTTIHKILTDMALACQFRQGGADASVAPMTLRNSTTHELYGGFHDFDDLLDCAPLTLSHNAVEYEAI